MRCALLLAFLLGCSPVADPIGGAWQRISDADGPITAPGVDRLWFTLGGHFRRELPARTFGGDYEEDDYADALTMRSGAWSWSGQMSRPECPPPRADRECLLIYDERGVRDLYRPLAPLADGVWF